MLLIKFQEAFTQVCTRIRVNWHMFRAHITLLTNTNNNNPFRSNFEVPRSYTFDTTILYFRLLDFV